jgi:hypothetical protein
MHLIGNLPVFGTLAVAALLAGPLSRLPIDLGAWLLECCLRGCFIARRTDLTPRNGRSPRHEE